jgi:Coenzyme PQQ synthesis protein D (PqqD)
MTTILHSASYVWNDAAPFDVQAHEAMRRALPDASDERTASAARRIWELLETPQTVETLCRVLRRELNVDPDVCTRDVRIVLDGLLREDLIQLSPDT